MSRKLTTSLGLFALLALAVPITWAAVSGGTGGTDPNVGTDPALVNESEMPEAQPELGPINVPLQDALYRSGLNPRTLAAAGVTPAQVAAMCTALRAGLAEVQPILDAADAGVSGGRRSVGRLSRLVRSGKATAEQVQELASCKAACQAAIAERKTCMNSFRTTALAGLSEAQRNALRNIRRNSEWKVPVPYRVVNRTPEQWMELEEFLDVERIETRWGHDVPAEVVTVLAEARSNQRFAAAKTALETNLAAVKAAANASIRD